MRCRFSDITFHYFLSILFGAGVGEKRGGNTGFIAPAARIVNGEVTTYTEDWIVRRACPHGFSRAIKQERVKEAGIEAVSSCGVTARAAHSDLGGEVTWHIAPWSATRGCGCSSGGVSSRASLTPTGVCFTKYREDGSCVKSDVSRGRRVLVPEQWHEGAGELDSSSTPGGHFEGGM